MSKEIPPMFSHNSFPRRAALVICAAIGASACSDAATSGARHPLTVSITTQAQSGVVADRALADITIAAGTNTLVITKAQIVARRIELAPAAATACANTTEAGDDDAESSDGCAEIEVGPTLLDIPVDAS